MDIDGKQVAETIRKKLKEQIAKEKLSLSLAFVLVGEDHASQTYVRMKEKACKEVGINSLRFDLPETVSEKDLLKLIHNLNNDKTVTSILVQMPLPKHINASHILLAIDPKKDRIIAVGETLKDISPLVSGKVGEEHKIKAYSFKVPHKGEGPYILFVIKKV